MSWCIWNMLRWDTQNAHTEGERCPMIHKFSSVFIVNAPRIQKYLESVKKVQTGVILNDYFNFEILGSTSKSDVILFPLPGLWKEASYLSCIYNTHLPLFCFQMRILRCLFSDSVGAIGNRIKYFLIENLLQDSSVASIVPSEKETHFF